MRRAMGTERRRVRFLLEPAVAAVQDREQRPSEGPLWLCSNGRSPAPQPGELEELEGHIEAVRERLRQALLRRGELRAQLGDGTHHRPLQLLQAVTVPEDTR